MSTQQQTEVFDLLCQLVAKLAEAGGCQEFTAAVAATVESDEKWMDAKAAARYMGIGYRTVNRMAADGNLKGRKVGRQWRFSKSACDKAMAAKGK